MLETKIIKIFVSCPGDVTPEKEQIQRLCKDFSEENIGKSNITFHVIDWKNYIGEYGIRPQEQINEYIRDYDVYIGILWKRFGTKPGSKNSTGKENESGTEEEFYNAIDSYEINKRPKIKFFIKNYNRETKDFSETKQLLKVDKFIKQQKDSNNDYLNMFDSEEVFNSKIVRLLKEIENEIIYNSNVEEKRIINDEIKIDIANLKPEIRELPKAYIERSISHLKYLQDKKNNPFLEIEKQKLDELIIFTKRVVLLGDAGSGKSTELANLYFKLNQKNSPFVPILQNFKYYTPDLGLEAFLPDFWSEIPNNLLLIIWDGLDEIQPLNFNTVIRQIKTFSEKYRELRIIISCRTNFYELPVSNSAGTLPGFEPYLINNLTIEDSTKYIQMTNSLANTDNFKTEVFNANLDDLITRPFFLMLIAEQFNREKKLSINKADLYEMFLINRIEFDQNHYSTTINLRSKKQEIILLLQKLALSMETLSKNYITESEILTLITSDEFDSLKYCTAFKKRDGDDNIWQFEHNNIQEFLAAKALSTLKFEKILQFIAFESNHNKVIPSWVNTLSFLFSILNVEDDLFKKLLKWMLENEKEIIVKFEPDKIQEEQRIKIFQGIFKYYKKHDIWISSNKFTKRELARFGKSEKNLRYLINQLQTKNSRAVSINAVELLGFFEIEDKKIKTKVETLFLKHIDKNKDDPYYIHSVIYAMIWAGFTSNETIKSLMKKLGDEKNQYIRSAMYAILIESEIIDENIAYLIEGYELIDKKISGLRDDISLVNEKLNLLECIKNIKSPEGIKEIVKYISESTKFEHEYDQEKTIKDIITNAINAYNKDNSVFEVILIWFLKHIKGYRFDKTDYILRFFNQTETREKAFYKVWNSIKEDKERNKSLVIAKLITPELIQFIKKEYLDHNLTNEQIVNIYNDMRWVNNEYIGKFEEFIVESTSIKVNKPEKIDYEALRREKLQKDFDLLFDKSSFKEAVINIFNELQKDELTFDELFEIKRENNRLIDIDEYYPSTAIELLRNFTNKDVSISKEEVENWFEEKEKEEYYRFSHIYNHVKNHKQLKINLEQKNHIIEWCTSYISIVNFKEALEVHDDDGRVTYKTIAMLIWYFSRRFEINYSNKDVLLDMLSFDFFDDDDLIGINYLRLMLNHEDIVRRMLTNLSEGIAHDTVLKNHIKYLVQNSVIKSYHLILKEIINIKRHDYHRTEFLEIYIEFTKDTEGLKTIIKQADSIIKWAILDKLKNNNQEAFVERYLLKLIKKSKDTEEIGKAAEILVTLQNIQGLKVYVDWIKNNIKNDIETNRASCLNSLKSVNALPFLIELLEFSFLNDIKVAHFSSFNSQVLGAFHNIALVSEESFMKVKSILSKFKEEKSSIHENVKYIVYSIERMEEQFYMNCAKLYSAEQVKEKVKLLGA